MPSLDRFFKASVLRRLSPLVIAVCALAAAPAHAVDYTEIGDAGQTVATGQSTTGAAGTLSNIFGTISASNDADLFLINITSPGSFSAQTFNVGGDLDTQLFLFTLSGAPVFGNDDNPNGTTLLSLLPTATGLGPVGPGLYYLGVSLSGYFPVNSVGQALFDGEGFDIQGPTTGLQPATLAGFDGQGDLFTGGYRIQLTGAAVAIPPVPEPSSALLLLAGGALGAAHWARRSRKAQAGVAAV